MNGFAIDLNEWYPDPRPEAERIALEQFLDLNRKTALSKLLDLDESQASAYVLPATNLTVGGIVKHLAWAEDRWFQQKLLGVPLPEPWASAPLKEDPDWPFTSARDDLIGDIASLYEAACARSRDAAAKVENLDTLAAVPSTGMGAVNLRWIYVHMIEEIARHAGHLDLLRDAIDA